jgi:hypothetical protein
MAPLGSSLGFVKLYVYMSIDEALWAVEDLWEYCRSYRVYWSYGNIQEVLWKVVDVFANIGKSRG